MIDSISYVVYQHQDLGRIRAFLLDFGLLIVDETPERIYFRGYGSAPFIYLAEKGADNRFAGVGLNVSSQEDLEALAAKFNTKIDENPRPGGGQRIVITDPDNKPYELVYGARPIDPIATREPLLVNTSENRNRLGRMPIYDQDEPIPVIKLAHCVMSSPNPQRIVDWLVSELGAYLSDTIAHDNGVPMLAFLRFPKGAEYVEHHNIAVSLGSKPGAQHTCFQTIDFDAVFMGHRYLVRHGHKPTWGPVRHSLGGGISDYWRDPSGFILEHVTDGDYLNDETPSAVSPATNELSLLQWTSQPIPHDFVE